MSRPNVRRIAGDVIAVLAARWHFRGGQVGSRVRLWGRATIRNRKGVVLGERVRIVGKPIPFEAMVGEHGKLEIGPQSFINYGASIAALELVRIGARANIGTYAMIMDNDFHEIDPGRRDEMPESKPIIIGDDVWIGGRVIILRGVTIGDGCVIAAGSVVAADVPPRTVAAGVPAKVIRHLDDPA